MPYVYPIVKTQKAEIYNNPLCVYPFTAQVCLIPGSHSTRVIMTRRLRNHLSCLGEVRNASLRQPISDRAHRPNSSGSDQAPRYIWSATPVHELNVSHMGSDRTREWSIPKNLPY
jgi:hypothetical protein